MPICGMKRAGIRALPFLLCILLLVALLPGPAGAESIDYGDVDGDGKIDVVDVALVMRHVLGFEPLTAAQQKRADVNADGRIDVQDVTLIMQRALNIIETFPIYAVESVAPRSKTVEFGTLATEIVFPGTVIATLDNGASYEIPVTWASESTPAYRGNLPGEYVFAGELTSLPGNITNPDEVKATFVVTVMESDLDFAYIRNEMDLWDARNAGVDVIILENNITLTEMHRIRWNLHRLDLNENRITLTNGPLVFENNGTIILNGRIVGTRYNRDAYPAAYTDGTDAKWDGADGWQNDEAVLVSAECVEFRNVTFDANFADWYQVQNSPAKDLRINTCRLNGVSIFVSDVEIFDSVIRNRVGIENDFAVLDNVTLRSYSDEADGVGILYVAADAALSNIHWRDRFTGMYVGKSLKYHGDEDDGDGSFANGKYVPAEPRLENATIYNDKYNLSWWVITHYKAILHVSGTIDSYSDGGGPALMLLGTDYRDYDGSEDFVGGEIKGTATFRGADVWFGKPTWDFLEEYFKNYEGAVPVRQTGDGDKDPVCIVGVDNQACYSNADRLKIHGGPAFLSDVYIFTAANDYIGCTGDNDGDAPFNDSVWLGEVTLNTAYLWGDFTIVDRKTVTVINELVVSCGNIRGIFTRGSLAVTGECPDEFEDFERYGTLEGGRIISDTKPENVLVLGDGLLVRDMELHRFLYNVILETVRLEDITINVGDSNRNDSREVCGLTLRYDVHVWPGHHATFNNVSWSPATRVGIMNDALLSLTGNISNRGTLHHQIRAYINIAADAVFHQDICTGHSLVIEQGAERIFVRANYAAKSNWRFENWKLDYLFTTTDDAIESTKYEFYFPLTEERFIVDLRDLARPDLDFTKGVWLTDIIEEYAVNQWPLNGAFPAPQPVANDNDSFVVRITAQDNKSFNLKVEAWARNSCNEEQILLAGDQKDVNLVGKIIQAAFFEARITDLPTEEVTEGDTFDATFRVKNTGGITGAREIKAYLFVNDVRNERWIYDESGDEMVISADGDPDELELVPGENWTFTVTIPTAAANGLFGPGTYRLRLETENQVATETVTVVAATP